jgi:hypothetical protein
VRKNQRVLARACASSTALPSHHADLCGATHRTPYCLPPGGYGKYTHSLSVRDHASAHTHTHMHTRTCTQTHAHSHTITHTPPHTQTHHHHRHHHNLIDGAKQRQTVTHTPRGMIHPLDEHHATPLPSRISKSPPTLDALPRKPTPLDRQNPDGASTPSMKGSLEHFAQSQGRVECRVPTGGRLYCCTGCRGSAWGRGGERGRAGGSGSARHEYRPQYDDPNNKRDRV